jgi:hypothetical protein
MPLETLNRARIVQALNRLEQRAEQEGVTLELCLFGGAAMMPGIQSMAQVEAHLDRFYPHDVLSPQARQVIADLLPKAGRETP